MTSSKFKFPNIAIVFRDELKGDSAKTKNAWPKNARPKLLGEPAQCETAKQSKCEQRATQQVVKKKNETVEIMSVAHNGGVARCQ